MTALSNTGHGFMEAMSVKLAGYSNVYLEREIVIRRSSSVGRIFSYILGQIIAESSCFHFPADKDTLNQAVYGESQSGPMPQTQCEKGDEEAEVDSPLSPVTGTGG